MDTSMSDDPKLNPNPGSEKREKREESPESSWLGIAVTLHSTIHRLSTSQHGI